MFYVIGHDESGKLIAMTSRAFPTQETAQEYAATCNQSWTPFVVQSCQPLDTASKAQGVHEDEHL